MNTLLTYIAIGTTFMFLVDMFLRTKTFNKYAPNPDVKMRNQDRIAGILLWPILLGVFLWSFFAAFLRHNQRPPHTRKRGPSVFKKNKKKKKK
jgi:uncharacterized protein with PQ loop repeat